MPGGALHLGLDPLSALFLLPIFFVGGVAAAYGAGYLKSDESKPRIGRTWLYYGLLMATMAAVVLARDGLVFLVSWEVMALCPLFLVTYDHERAEARRAAWIYMVASHLGAICLVAFFLLAGGGDSSLDFDSLRAAASSGEVSATLLFGLAVVGFGSKAGFVPLHVWLPEAHPAAPSHISALMSGVMIKMGIYGLVRALCLLGAPHEGWGWVLIGIGASSGILGVVFALAQHDLKRLLAYHSVENIGIITIGLGVGVVGWATGSVPMAVLGFGGGLLHVVNHSLFKSLLFLGAGSVLHGAHTLELEKLGGLTRRMPVTAATFLIGSAAIVGLPPLNGFVSEFLLLLASIFAIPTRAPGVVVSAMASIAAIGLIGGLAAACFVKAHGTVFLGTPRSEAAAEAHESSRVMQASMVILAVACVVMGLAGWLVVSWLSGPIAQITGWAPGLIAAPLSSASTALSHSLGVFAAVLVLVGALAMWRSRLHRSSAVESAETWGCGYPATSPRVQYTASSFAHPLTRQMASVLLTTEPTMKIDGLYPQEQSFHSATPDPFQARLIEPLFGWIRRASIRVRVIQQGSVHLYVLYIGLTLLVLLLGWGR